MRINKFLIFLVSCLLVVPLSFVNAVCVPPASDMIAWWPFDETSGSVANDIIDNRDGVYINGPQQTQGLVGNALHFTNANQQYVGAPDSDLWAFGDKNFTVEFWANFDWNGGGTTSHPGDIFLGNDEGPFNQNKWFISLGQGFLNFVINGPTIGPQFFPYAIFTPTIGQWYHIAVTRDGNNYTIYINGTPSASILNNYFIPNPNAPLTIGQAEGLGYMHGSLDEMSIYHKALSPQELQAIVAAGPDGKCKNIQITTSSAIALQANEFSSLQFEAELGTAPYTWSIINGNIPAGMNFYQDGVLNGTPSQSGNFTFRVRATDSQNNFGEKDIAVEIAVTLPPANIRVYKTGTTAVPGRDIDYFIVAENVGTTLATNLEVVEYLEPEIFTLLETNPATIISIDDLLNISIAVWLIDLAPQERKILHYRVHLTDTILPGTEVTGHVDIGRELANTFSQCLQSMYPVIASCTACVVPCSVCFRPTPGGFCPPFFTVEIPACLLCLGDGLCGPCVIKPGPSGRSCLYNGWNLAMTCNNDAARGLGRLYDSFVHKQNVRVSLDPNEKEVIANKYIQPEQRLPYVIHYENIGTADAQDIFVTDDLDPEYNLSTVEVLANNAFIPISNGQTVILFQQNQTRTINQTIGNQTFEFNITYFENHTVSLMNNRLRWELLNIHLEPNVTDQVIMTVTPNAGLIDGDIIRNDAEIVFDINQPIITNETLNIIDNTKPECTVNALPPETNNQNIALRWSGSDPFGEIDAYSIFMSKNNGAFISTINNTRDLNNTLEVEGSGKYSFICIATDTAGNVEVQPPTPEAATHVNLATISMSGTPRVGQTITFSLTDSSQPNTPYVFLLAERSLPGIPLGDGRIIPLIDDIIFRISLFAPQTFGMVNSQGVLNSNGQATVTINIPNQPFLANVNVVGAYVTLDLSKPLPDMITAISPAVPINIQP